MKIRDPDHVFERSWESYESEMKYRIRNRFCCSLHFLSLHSVLPGIHWSRGRFQCRFKYRPNSIPLPFHMAHGGCQKVGPKVAKFLI
jgi:hypothetical protein